SYGVPVERYVFDAIRRLVKTGKWKVNEPGAKVWHLNQGVFIAWKQLGDLYDLISHDKIPGIPRDPDTLADILIERGFAVPNTVQEKGERAYYRYWEVLPEMLQEAAGSVKILMLRLESNDLVFTTEPPAAVAAEVVGDVEDAEIEFVDPEEVDD
ncbi:conjugal transfer protein TraI, partial [Vibrio parahaemolyticus]